MHAHVPKSNPLTHTHTHDLTKLPEGNAPHTGPTRAMPRGEEKIHLTSNYSPQARSTQPGHTFAIGFSDAFITGFSDTFLIGFGDTFIVGFSETSSSASATPS